MPRNSSGIYSLPDGYKAETGTTILASQHNPPLEDVAAALTGSLPRNGSSPMTGVLRAVSGDIDAPGISFVDAPNRGFINTPSGVSLVIDGQVIAAFGPGGFIGLPIGTPIPILDDTLPALCIWADGRNVFRASYSLLFARWADKYGAGDGTTTFGVPDLRGRVLAGRDNTGGTDAGRLTGVTGVTGSRLVTGSTLGAGRITLAIGQIPAHNHSGSTTSAAPNHTHPIPEYAAFGSGGVGGPLVIATGNTVNSGSGGTHSHTVTIASQGGGGAHDNMPPTLLCNWAIYAGE